MWETLFSISKNIAGKILSSDESNTMGDKIYISVICVLAIGIISCVVWIKLLKSDIAVYEAQNKQLNSLVDIQNEKIKEFAIKQQDKSKDVVEKVVVKYQEIAKTTIDNTCESQLRALNEMANSYFYRK